MNPHEPSTKKPGRHINKLVIAGFLGLLLLALLGIVFIPWDVPVPKVPDLEMKPTLVPATENAFTYFETANKMRVFNFVSPTGKTRYSEELLQAAKPSGEPTWDPLFANEVLTANAAAMAELEKGLACQRYAGPTTTDVLANEDIVAGCRGLIVLLSVKSKRAQMAGNYAEASQAALQGLRLGQLITDNVNSQMEWLCGTCCAFVSVRRLEELVADPHTPKPILIEIATALDAWGPQKMAQRYRQAMRADYQSMRDTIKIIGRDDLAYEKWQKKWVTMWGSGNMPVTSPGTCLSYAWKPNQTIRTLASFYRNQLLLADKPYAKINLHYPGKPCQRTDAWGKISLYGHPNSVGKKLFFMVTQHVEDLSLLAKYGVDANVAALRLKIALRLYELKHGELPATLNALVPEYLPEIPLDPYDGQPLRYSKAEKKIWAIGEDLIDQGGAMKDNAIMLYRGKGSDAVMPLTPRDPNPAPLKEEPKP